MRIIIYGSAGHAKVVADIVEKAGEHQIIGFIDDTRSEVGLFMGYPVYTSICDPHLDGTMAGIIAIGDNWARASIAEKIRRAISNFSFVKAIHPASQLGRGVKIGEGTVVMPGVCVNADTIVGRHCILNTSSSIDHDCTIQDFASIAPGVVIGGNVTIGNSTAVGLGANIVHKVTIGKHTVIGAGSLVTNAIPDNIVAYGSPCKFVRNRDCNDSYL